MNDKIKFSKTKKSTLFIQHLFMWIIIFSLVVSIKYLFVDVEKGYWEYLFSTSHFSMVHLVIAISDLYYIFEEKYIIYDDRQICLSVKGLFSNRDICIEYKNIDSITNKFGLGTIRGDNKQITMYNIDFNSNDIQRFMKLMEEKDNTLMNQKVKKSDIILLFFAILFVGSLMFFMYKIST